jgi:hypothetical protein
MIGVVVAVVYVNTPVVVLKVQLTSFPVPSALSVVAAPVLQVALILAVP